MFGFSRFRRVWAVGLAVVLAATAAVPAVAKNSPGGSDVPALPEPLTRESVRELVSRLSDDEVRKLLLDQLDRAAAVAPAKGKGAMGMSGRMDEHAEMMRTNFAALQGALADLPQTMRQVEARLTEPDGPSQLLIIVEILAALLAAGWVVEAVYDRALRGYRSRLANSSGHSFSANAFRRGVGLLLDIGGIVVWSLAALTVFFLIWHDHDLRRTTILDFMILVAIVRVAVLVARFLFAKGAGSERLLPFADAPAATLRRFAVALAAIFGGTIAAVSLLRGAGASEATIDIAMIVAVTSGILLTIGIVWRVRLPIANLIRGDGTHGAIRGSIADLWPVIATLYFLGVLIARISDALAGASEVDGTAIVSVLLVVALPIVDMTLCRALAAAASEQTGRVARARGFLASYQQVFQRAIHIVVVVVGLLLFGHVWGINLFAFAQRNLGGQISSSLLGVSIVVLLAYILWEGAKTAIDRRLAAEGELDAETPASRLRTLLPILRVLILVTIFVIATMSVLAALGVDIVPVLAGASVIGVAIGFGSQTLVRDVVSGAFFLMDDAFRLGEYIEVGDAKGRVEKINVRSLFLRHHRGALNILPYGEIKRLRNTNRDWMIMVMDFRLTYDTNLSTVKKIMKQVGDELAADPELAPDLLQPLKMGGVMSTEDSAIVIRAKFTARPEGEPYMIRKAAYTKILKAFREAGIKFAHRQVTVYVPPSSNGDAKTAAAGAAALAAAAPDPAL
ncbi:MAG: mechanosensitive ion channel family protein [Betaproteobacteria bacterium]